MWILWRGDRKKTHKISWKHMSLPDNLMFRMQNKHYEEGSRIAQTAMWLQALLNLRYLLFDGYSFNGIMSFKQITTSLQMVLHYSRTQQTWNEKAQKLIWLSLIQQTYGLTIRNEVLVRFASSCYRCHRQSYLIVCLKSLSVFLVPQKKYFQSPIFWRRPWKNAKIHCLWSTHHSSL